MNWQCKFPHVKKILCLSIDDHKNVWQQQNLKKRRKHTRHSEKCAGSMKS